MRVTATLDSRAAMSLAPEWARQHEALGFDTLRVAEAEHNPFTPLTLVAEHTERVDIGTGVAIAFARSPYVMASYGWDLQQYSRGRLSLGIGTQVRAHNERRFGVPWSAPTERLREYIAVMRAVWHAWRTGEQPSYEGEHYRFTLSSYRFNPGPIEYPDPPLLLAAVRPRHTRLAAQVGDGVLWHPMMSRDYRDTVLMPALEEGARRAGKDPRDLVIGGGGFVCTARDQAGLAAQLGEARRTLAFFGSTPAYQDSIRLAGFDEEAALLHRLSIEQRWAEMAKLISDDFLERFAIVATWDELPARMAERYGGVNSEVSFDPQIENPDDAAHAREVIERLRAIPARGEIEPPSFAP